MDGTAAVGAGTTYARADHVHPSDTSRAPIASPTFTGTVTLPADPTTGLGAATKQYADTKAPLASPVFTGTPSLPTGATGVTQAAFNNSTALATTAYVDTSAPVNVAGGYLSKLRNGTFDVWQRGTSFSAPASATYVADGWIIGWAGAAPAIVQRLAMSAAGPLTAGASEIQIQGAAGNTFIQLMQRIESYVSAQLGNGVTVTFSCWAYCVLAVTPQLSVMYPSTADTAPWTNSIIANQPLQPMAAATWTRLAYTFAIPAGQALNGLQVVLITNPTGLTSGSFYCTSADLRATPGLAVGLQANPPPPELRPIHEETIFCQRYYQRHGYLYGFAPSATQIAVNWTPLVLMRINPTVTLLTTTPAGESPPFATSRSGTASTLGVIHSTNGGGDVLITGFTGLTALQPASLLPNQISFSAEL
jgi:hypothetical protein